MRADQIKSSMAESARGLWVAPQLTACQASWRKLLSRNDVCVYHSYSFHPRCDGQQLKKGPHFGSLTLMASIWIVAGAPLNSRNCGF